MGEIIGVILSLYNDTDLGYINSINTLTPYLRNESGIVYTLKKVNVESVQTPPVPVKLSHNHSHNRLIWTGLDIDRRIFVQNLQFKLKHF